jgi:hypothetical protein
LCKSITKKVETQHRKPNRDAGRRRQMWRDQQECAARVQHIAQTRRGRQRA